VFRCRAVRSDKGAARTHREGEVTRRPETMEGIAEPGAQRAPRAGRPSSRRTYRSISAFPQRRPQRIRDDRVAFATAIAAPQGSAVRAKVYEKFRDCDPGIARRHEQEDRDPVGPIDKGQSYVSAESALTRAAHAHRFVVSQDDFRFTRDKAGHHVDGNPTRSPISPMLDVRPTTQPHADPTGAGWQWKI